MATNRPIRNARRDALSSRVQRGQGTNRRSRTAHLAPRGPRAEADERPASRGTKVSFERQVRSAAKSVAALSPTPALRLVFLVFLFFRLPFFFLATQSVNSFSSAFAPMTIRGE